MKKIFAAIIFLLAFSNKSSFAQFTHADTLRGTNGASRNWWDVTKYDLHVKFNLHDSTISGFNIVSFKKINSGNLMQIDLQEPMMLDSILMNNTEKLTAIKKDGNAYFVTINSHLKTQNNLKIYYHGKPKIATRAPWDGGVVWSKDKNGNPWISIACQGLGASVWYPCKDIQADEPDSAEIHITAPSDLISVSNGRLRNKEIHNDGTSTYSWAVVNPINNYCLIPSIGKYVNFNEIYGGEKGALTMDYWVLEQNLEKAKTQFKDAPKMMKAFEYWFGPYPFYEDGYKLVDAPYLGMEHQSAVAYGNGYQNGYHGLDLSGSGVGMKWDFIIVHESGHEWFANNITTKDIADMWVHEGFTNYSETLFTDYYFGKENATKYIAGLRTRIENDKPIIGRYGVNNEGSSDMYYKAGNMLHTIRQVINNDEKFRSILRGLNQTFYHQTVTTKQIENYINDQAGIDFSKVFDQYLRTIKIPVLEYKIKNKKLSYRWANCVRGFNMPVKIENGKGKFIFITPTEKFKQMPFNAGVLKVDQNFCITAQKIN